MSGLPFFFFFFVVEWIKFAVSRSLRITINQVSSSPYTLLNALSVREFGSKWRIFLSLSIDSDSFLLSLGLQVIFEAIPHGYGFLR